MAPERGSNEKGLIHTLDVPKLLQREISPDKGIAPKKTMLLID